MPINIFGPTYDLLSKVLDLRSQRHTVVSSNIANADTPGYKATRMNFEKELEKMIPDEKKIKLKTTDTNHIPKKTDFSSIQGEVIEKSAPATRPDGNTVDLDKEIVRMSKNQLMYNAVSQVIAKKFRSLYNIIKEVR